MPSCVVRWCKTHSRLTCPGLTIHSFPSNPIRRKEWIAAVRLERQDNNWMPTKASNLLKMGNQDLSKYLKKYGVGHRGFADPLFLDDKPPQRLGVYDEDEESLCHQVIKTCCHIPGCNFSSDTILGFEAHYNASHRFRCEQCRKNLPSAHLLDLHIQEAHDSFFAVLATRKPCYACFIEECKDKFNNPEERTEHCISIHKLPKDFRFDIPSKQRSKKNAQKMDVEVPGPHKSKKDKPVKLANSKVKMFPSTIKRDTNVASGSKPKEDSDKMEE